MHETQYVSLMVQCCEFWLKSAARGSDVSSSHISEYIAIRGDYAH